MMMIMILIAGITILIMFFFVLKKTFINTLFQISHRFLGESFQSFRIIWKAFSPISQLKEGMVAVEGKIVSESVHELETILSKTPCYWYQYSIEMATNSGWDMIIEEDKDNFIQIKDEYELCIISTHGADITGERQKMWGVESFPFLPLTRNSRETDIIEFFYQIIANSKKTNKLQKFFTNHFIEELANKTTPPVGQPGNYRITEKYLNLNQTIKVFGYYKKFTLQDIEELLQYNKQKLTAPLTGKEGEIVERIYFLLDLKDYLIKTGRKSISLIHKPSGNIPYIISSLSITTLKLHYSMMIIIGVAFLVSLIIFM